LNEEHLPVFNNDREATNGKDIYEIDTINATEGSVGNFMSPDELWNKTFEVQNQWREKLSGKENK
jgi:type I restriction enzyme R subunit